MKEIYVHVYTRLLKSYDIMHGMTYTTKFMLSGNPNPNHRGQYYLSSVIISKVIYIFRFHLVSVAAILDLGKSRILPIIATPANGGT